jgi:hypothetical protein
MEFSPQVKAWILLVCLVFGTGITVGVTSFIGGANKWIATLCGLATGLTNLYHALSDKPSDKDKTK